VSIFHLTPPNLALPGFAGADPVAGLAGGILIGLAAAFTLVGLGRIAGISGIAARAFGLSAAGMPRAMAIAFLLGLPLGAWLIRHWLGAGGGDFPNWPFLLLAGLFVGFGTRMGAGCTSGHGVCGLSRLSGRSIVATTVFLTWGVITVAVMRAVGIGN
jgi:uncharacterized membrane protein YedE/YeeE